MSQRSWSALLASRVVRRQLVFLALLLIALYVFVPQLQVFASSLALIRDVNWYGVLLATALTVLTYPVAALLYQILARKRLRYGRTLLVQCAGAFVNRLLPAGLGGLGLNAVYLHREKHSVGQALAVVAVNNGLGIVAHVVLLTGVLLVVRLPVDGVRVTPLALGYVGVICAAGVAIGIVLRRVRTRIARAMSELLRAFASYRREPAQLLWALLVSAIISILYTLIMWFCAQALQVDISLVESFVVFTISVSLGGVTPTPGGLVGAEAGLVAGLIGFGIEAPSALAVTLLYRLVTYWLMLMPGLLATVIVERRLKLF